MHGMTPAMLEALCDITIELRDEHMMSDIINDHGTFLTSPKKLSGVKEVNHWQLTVQAWRVSHLLKGFTYTHIRINRNPYIFNTLQSDTCRLEHPVAYRSNLWTCQIYDHCVHLSFKRHISPSFLSFVQTERKRKESENFLRCLSFILWSFSLPLDVNMPSAQIFFLCQ